VAEIVRSHHERWDGQGYPMGARGAEIPPESRIVSVCDAYRVLTSERPGRRALPEGKALALVQAGAGTLFDPQVVDCLTEILGEEGITPLAGFRKPEPGVTPSRGGSRLWGALEQLDSLPVLAESRQRMLEVLREPNPSSGKLVEAVEGDIALAAGVLRVANAGARQSKGRIGTLPEAVGMIGAEGVQLVMSRLPVADFFDGMSGWTVAPAEFRTHALAVRRSALAVAHVLSYADAEELAVAALLHDIGKLVLAGAHDGYARKYDSRHLSPDERVRAERRDLGLDHASIGALALRRWSLPEPIARAVEDHHAADAGGMAGMLRLADMLAHFSHGTPTAPRSLGEAARAVGMDDDTLRSLMYESPAGGNWERRASSEPSPLTPQETLALRGLAEGKLYKQIAEGMGLAPSTVRSHLHRAYGKLGVADRAQAVLLASDRGWI
jgi:putative nucleotidyltransferase with HDIG domain